MSYHRAGCFCPPSIDITISGIDANVCSVCVNVSGSVLYKLKSVTIDGTHLLSLVGPFGTNQYEYTATLSNVVTWETYTLGGGCDPGDYLGDVTDDADIRVLIGIGTTDDPCCRWIVFLSEIASAGNVDPNLGAGIFIGNAFGGKTCAGAIKLGSTIGNFYTGCDGINNRTYSGTVVIDEV